AGVRGGRGEGGGGRVGRDELGRLEDSDVVQAGVRREHEGGLARRRTEQGGGGAPARDREEHRSGVTHGHLRSGRTQIGEVDAALLGFADRAARGDEQVIRAGGAGRRADGVDGARVATG